MPIVCATVWLHDNQGRPFAQPMQERRVTETLEKITDYWRDPYTNVGFLKAIQRNKSHPGTYERHFPEEGDDA